MSRPWRVRCFEAALCAALCAALAAPAAAAESHGYHDGVRRGWYWYEKQKAPAPEAPEGAAAAPKTYPSLRGVTNRRLWDMDPDEFRALQEGIQKKAVRDPSPENIAEMMRVNDIARRKSLAYMNAMQAFLQSNPQYDMRTVYPDAAPGRRALAGQRMDEVSGRLAAEKGAYGLIYFHAPGCRYCEAQSGILDWFRREYGWDIRGYDVKERPDLARAFGVETVPSLFLIARRDGAHIPVAAGVVSVDEISERLYRGVRLLAGEITPEQYTTWGGEDAWALQPGPPPEDPGREAAP